MGTRADFYVGSGPNAEWLGSVAWDGYEWAEDKECALMKATTEPEFRFAVMEILDSRNDATYPNQGWPWPWDTSEITDFAYYWNGKTARHNHRKDWPNMSARRSLAAGTSRDSIMIFGG